MYLSIPPNFKKDCEMNNDDLSSTLGILYGIIKIFMMCLLDSCIHAYIVKY